jgi:hypothetical protein
MSVTFYSDFFNKYNKEGVQELQIWQMKYLQMRLITYTLQ